MSNQPLLKTAESEAKQPDVLRKIQLYPPHQTHPYPWPIWSRGLTDPYNRPGPLHPPKPILGIE